MLVNLRAAVHRCRVHPQRSGSRERSLSATRQRGNRLQINRHSKADILPFAELTRSRTGKFNPSFYLTILEF